MAADHFVHRLQVACLGSWPNRFARLRFVAGRADAGGFSVTVAVPLVGHLVVLKRQYGLRANEPPDIAIGKAGGRALGMCISTDTHPLPANVTGLLFRARFLAECLSDGRFIPEPGGVLVLNEAGDAIGACGHIMVTHPTRTSTARCPAVHRARAKRTPSRARPLGVDEGCIFDNCAASDFVPITQLGAQCGRV